MFNSPISFHGLIVNLVLSTEYNSIIWIYQSLSIYLLKAILVASKCWQWWIRYCRHLCEGFHVDINVLLLLLNIKKHIPLMAWWENVYFCKKPPICLAKWLFPFCTPTRNEQEFLWLHILPEVISDLNFGHSTRCLVIENLFSLKLYSVLTLRWSFCWAQFIHAIPSHSTNKNHLIICQKSKYKKLKH